MQKIAIGIIIAVMLAGIVFILVPSARYSYKKKDISPPQHMYNVRKIILQKKSNKRRTYGKNNNDSSNGKNLCR